MWYVSVIVVLMPPMALSVSKNRFTSVGGRHGIYLQQIKTIKTLYSGSVQL